MQFYMEVAARSDVRDDFIFQEGRKKCGKIRDFGVKMGKKSECVGLQYLGSTGLNSCNPIEESAYKQESKSQATHLISNTKHDQYLDPDEGKEQRPSGTKLLSDRYCC